MNIPITIVGNLGREAENRQTKNGKWVSNLAVAVTPREKRDGEWQDGETIWFRVRVWDNLPEMLFSKGSRVIVQGQLFKQSYEKDGVTRESFVIYADTIGNVYRSPQTGSSSEFASSPADTELPPMDDTPF